MLGGTAAQYQTSPWRGTPIHAAGDVLRLDYTSEHDGTPDWAILLPGGPGAELPGTELPGAKGGPRLWVILLHGHGSTSDQMLVRKEISELWLPAMQSRGMGMVCPNLRGNAWMGPAAAADLRQLIQMLRSQYAIDRLLMAGGSMGGTAALIYAGLHPEDVAGVVAMCPATDLASYDPWAAQHSASRPVLEAIRSAIHASYGSAPGEAKALFVQHAAVAQHHRLTMPIAFVHGDADAIIPVEQARALADRLAHREDVRYTELPDGDHDSPLTHFPEALAWVLTKMPS